MINFHYWIEEYFIEEQLVIWYNRCKAFNSSDLHQIMAAGRLNFALSKIGELEDIAEFWSESTEQ